MNATPARVERRPNAQAALRPSGILEAALYCPDLDRAETFYRNVLGMEVLTRQLGRLVFFRCGDAVLLLFNPAATETQAVEIGGGQIPPHGAWGRGHVAFRATDAEIDAWKAHLATRHLAVVSEVNWPTGGRSIYLEDPAGNVLEFATPRLWGLPDVSGVAPTRGRPAKRRQPTRRKR